MYYVIYIINPQSLVPSLSVDSPKPTESKKKATASFQPDLAAIATSWQAPAPLLPW
jgi:hypothetical protein